MVQKIVQQMEPSKTHTRQQELRIQMLNQDLELIMFENQLLTLHEFDRPNHTYNLVAMF